MGNCIQPDGPYMNSDRRGQKRMFPTNRASLLCKFEAVEGVLLLHRSIIQRNFQSIQPVLEELIENHQSASATFALKRQKLYETLLRKIDRVIEEIKELTPQLQLIQKKKDCLRTLSRAYVLLRDIGDLTKLEEALQEDEDDDRSIEEFSTFFDKYGVKSAEILEMIFTLDSQFALTQSTCIKKSAIPNFLSSNELPTICEAGC